MRDAAARLRYLDDVLGLLFPPSAGDGRPDVRGPGDSRSVLPHRLLPRRVVPRRWWHAALGRPLPVGGGSGTIETYLGEVFGRRVGVVARVRPARRANRKPVLEAYDASGLVAFVKIGDSERARGLVRHESEVLRVLADRPLKVVVPPGVLHHGVWRGLEVLVLSPLPVPSRGVPAARRRVPPALLAAAVREIAGLGPHGTPAWHGDFTPWNVAAAADGRLLVWDWERYAEGVPLGFDALHHFFHRALRRMPPPVAARACLAQSGRVLEPFAMDASTARRTAAHYLITLADRHHRDGHEPLGPPGTWLSPLVDHLESLP